MLSSRRRHLALGLLATAALAACGFTPAYAPSGPAAALTGAIEVAAPISTEDYTLVKQLEKRLGQPQSPRYALSYDLKVTESGVGITPSQETTRYHVSGALNYSVLDLTSGQQVDSGKLQSFTGYAATGSTTATLKATRDARARLSVILADQLVTRLIAHVGNWPK